MNLDDQELARIWRERIRDDLFDQAEPSPHPVTILVGGQPGAGKTLGGERADRSHPYETITPIIGDNLRAYHPQYREVLESDPLRMPEVTAQASGRWIGMSVDHANEQGYSIRIEGTWRSAQVALDGARLAREHGRRTHAVVVAVPAAVSRLSTMERYYKDTDAGKKVRWTPPEAHDRTIATLPAVVEQVAASEFVDRFTVTDRSGAELLDLHGGSPAARGTAAAGVFRSDFERPLNAAERAQVLATVPQLLAAHERHTADRPDAQALATWARGLHDDVLSSEPADVPKSRTPRPSTPPREVSRHAYRPDQGLQRGSGRSL